MISAALSASVLCFSALFAVFLLAQIGSFAESKRPAALAALISFTLVSLAALTAGLYYGFDWQLQPAVQLFSNAAVFLGLPLIAGAYLSLCWPFSFSKPAWGRAMLALMALFALMRQLGWGEPYQQGVAIISLGLIILMGLKHRKLRAFAGFTVIGAGSLLVGGLLIVSEGPLADFLRLNLFLYLSALSCLLLSSGLFLQLRPRSIEPPKESPVSSADKIKS